MISKLVGIVDCGELSAWKLGISANTLTNRISANSSTNLVVRQKEFDHDDNCNVIDSIQLDSCLKHEQLWEAVSHKADTLLHNGLTISVN